MDSLEVLLQRRPSQPHHIDQISDFVGVTPRQWSHHEPRSQSELLSCISWRLHRWSCLKGKCWSRDKYLTLMSTIDFLTLRFRNKRSVDSDVISLWPDLFQWHALHTEFLCDLTWDDRIKSNGLKQRINHLKIRIRSTDSFHSKSYRHSIRLHSDCNFLPNSTQSEYSQCLSIEFVPSIQLPVPGSALERRTSSRNVSTRN